MSQRFSTPLLVAALLVAGSWIALPLPPVAGLAQQDAGEKLPPPTRAPSFRGTGSCASAACHGGTDAIGAKRCEYTTWMTKDKHVRAYEVLLTERSKIIERNYRPDSKDPRPEKDMLCLRCHAMNPEGALAGQYIAYADGIGCERCHGPAEQWLAVHYRQGWSSKSDKDKEAIGFRPLKDLGVRAKLCIECHVGVGNTQVDHDLIAAGHPRLNFEFAAYQAVMPPHWSVREERERYPDFHARSWALGQVASAQAALELLAFRADAGNKAPWPEFSEYDCFACHHDLKADSGRVKRGYGVRVPGTIPWADWYYVLARNLRGADAQLVDDNLRDSLEALKKEMDRPLPNRDKVTDLARKAAAALGTRQATFNRQQPWGGRDVHNWFAGVEALVDKPPRELTRNWDSASQGFLALAALYNGMTDLDPKLGNADTAKRLQRMPVELRFPHGFDSPRGTQPPYFVSPSKTPEK
ncbi:MAG: cytochrome c family protein [Gemmataceae bacterium]|nr:cytochrome c family protein [Gemmataceae bacterium]